MSDAQVSQHDRINRANDQVAEFYGLFQEYQQNRDVVYERVFREKVVTIFNQMGGKIVLPDGDQRRPDSSVPEEGRLWRT